MSNEIKIFENKAFSSVRVTIIDGDPWFVGVDACKVLGIKDPTTSIRILDEDEKGVHTMHTPGGDQNLVIINEAGLYSLILRSRKPEAKVFKRWVTHEVLPSIRKYGMYATDDTLDKLIADPRYAAKLFTELADERDKNKKLQATVETQAVLL